jgi:tetratricopeptide (TPR) repeat protein
LIERFMPTDWNKVRQQHYEWGRAAEAAGKNERALKHYRSACNTDPTHLPTLLALAKLLYRTEHWEGAFNVYQTILIHHRDHLSREQVVDTFHRLGSAKLQLGERKKALNMFEKALELDATHRPSQEAVADLLRELKTHCPPT